jgi:hypothetical protein
MVEARLLETMSQHPFMVLVPSVIADETTMGEWLEGHGVDYVAVNPRPRHASAFEFYFASKEAADRFARTFIG